MNTKHTPGPWKYDDKTRNVLAADGSIVCRNGDSVYGYPEAGQFLAASPDLLAALEAALPQIQRFRCTDPNGETCDNPVLQQARAAIAKAKGE